jgi:hypothetical protein
MTVPVQGLALGPGDFVNVVRLVGPKTALIEVKARKRALPVLHISSFPETASFICESYWG